MNKKRSFFERAEKKEKQLKKELKETDDLSAKDIFAMLISAFIVFLPICIVILAALSALVLWLFKAI